MLKETHLLIKEQPITKLVTFLIGLTTSGKLVSLKGKPKGNEVLPRSSTGPCVLQVSEYNLSVFSVRYFCTALFHGKEWKTRDMSVRQRERERERERERGERERELFYRKIPKLADHFLKKKC